MVRVFISYSHDSPAHQDRSLALSDRLCAEGVDCQIDRYEESPPEGWPRWCARQVEEASFVLVVCTQTYLRRFNGEEAPQSGLGGTWEGHIITQELYDAQGRNTKFIPILFCKEDSQFIPAPLRSATCYRLFEADVYDRLYRRLTNQPMISKPVLGHITPLPPGRHQDVQPSPQAQPNSATTLRPLPTETPPRDVKDAEEPKRALWRQIWTDPVWSKIIATSILGVLSGVFSLVIIRHKEAEDPPAASFPLTVYVHGPGGLHDLVLANSGKVTLKLGPDPQTARIGERGEAYFPAIPAKFRGRPVSASVQWKDCESLGELKPRLDGTSVDLPVKAKICSYRLAGTVFDMTRNPLSGVRIMLLQYGAHTTTDDHGRFELQVSAPNQETVRLIAQKEGYDTTHQSPSLGDPAVNFTLKRRR